ncbi:MAG: carbon storage regulator [Legionellaceae bacterium]|nr:carbon storage regulator [Legionellaceae bacterium]|tara:strand:- start:882 stop:1118 length:237 start_codon:yes stop_codon:yes gene_type:complete
MLILTRKIAEAIFINGEEIKVRVLEINGTQVKLGFEAPKHINIYRQEIAERIAAANKGNIRYAKKTLSHPSAQNRQGA